MKIFMAYIIMTQMMRSDNDLLKSLIANLGFYQISSNFFQGKYNTSFFDKNSVPIINPFKQNVFLRTSLLLV